MNLRRLVIQEIRHCFVNLGIVDDVIIIEDDNRWTGLLGQVVDQLVENGRGGGNWGRPNKLWALWPMVLSSCWQAARK